MKFLNNSLRNMTFDAYVKALSLYDLSFTSHEALNYITNIYINNVHGNAQLIHYVLIGQCQVFELNKHALLW